MFLAIESVGKTYGKQRVLDAVSFSVNKGELVSLIGPSGAGKTTLLKIIAGLETADFGTVSSAADLVTNPAILVFQDYLLFPTMTVFDNVAFGLQCRKVSRQEISEKVSAMLAYFQLAEKVSNYPNQLSAGQQQRVALARAMVVSPSILLLDEPFANLDRNLKAETAEFIRAFQREYQITTISVTHDLQEAFMMSDKIGIMLNGRLCQFDVVKKIYDEPVSTDVADFLGHVNRIPRKCFQCLGIDPQTVVNALSISVRAEAIELHRDDGGAGRIEDILFAGHFVIYRVQVKDISLTVYSFDADLAKMDRVSVKVKKFSRVEGE